MIEGSHAVPSRVSAWWDSFLSSQRALKGLWQWLLINLGTGALLFVALEYLLYGMVERVRHLVAEALDGFSFERGMELLSWTEQVSMDELPAVQPNFRRWRRCHRALATGHLAVVAFLSNPVSSLAPRDALPEFFSSGLPHRGRN